jgi:hypothetical protein
MSTSCLGKEEITIMSLLSNGNIISLSLNNNFTKNIDFKARKGRCLERPLIFSKLRRMQSIWE